MLEHVVHRTCTRDVVMLEQHSVLLLAARLIQYIVFSVSCLHWGKTKSVFCVPYLYDGSEKSSITTVRTVCT